MPQDWRKVAPGGTVTEPGSAVTVETGTWRSSRPVVDYDHCVHCMICWVFCPDDCFQTENGKLVGVDYFHCKGCGICTVECPKKCISMQEDVLA